MLDCRAIESEIAGHAVWASGQVRNLIKGLDQIVAGGAPVVSLVHPDRIEWERAPARTVLPVEVRCELDNLAHTFGVSPVASGIALDGRIARMADAGWWIRKLRRELLRENERQEHAAGQVQKKLQYAVTDWACKQKAERDKANQLTLAGLEIVCAEGEALNLGEVAEASISNPKHRRAELMTRCRGFEEVSQWMGHDAWFLTLTTPKRYHRKDAFGRDVSKWDGSTPKDGQEYLCKVWSRIRAAWKNAGIVVYGFRVAEPHQDGTPHWHVLLFCSKEHSKKMLSIAGKRAMAKDRYESGAKQHRFTAKRIDPAKGGATGYIAKYICKNIDGVKEDGQGMGLCDESETPADAAAHRVRVWASTWGIRQFQQIGGPSVTVWREFRRLGEDAAALQRELFEKPRAAANRASWFEFWMCLGGPDVPSRMLSVKPYYVADSMGKYGDESKKIKGVQGLGWERVVVDGVEEMEHPVEITRLKDWTVQRAGLDWVNEQLFDLKTEMAFKRNNAAFLKAYEDAEFKRIGAAERTRTGVNNCTPAKKEGFDFSDFPSVGVWTVPESGINRAGDHHQQLEEVDFLCKQLHELNNSPDFLNWRARFETTHTTAKPSPQPLN